MEALMPPELELQRRVAIDACLIRIMKARGTMKWVDLFQRTEQILGSRFPVVKRQVKERVDALIDREYLVRSESDMATIDYVQ